MCKFILFYFVRIIVGMIIILVFDSMYSSGDPNSVFSKNKKFIRNKKEFFYWIIPFGWTYFFYERIYKKLED